MSIPAPPASVFATRMPLLLDMPGLFFVEASKRINRGAKNLDRLLVELTQHRERVSSAGSTHDLDAAEDGWTDVLQGVGSLEPLFGATISDLAVADVLLVAAAESYINAIASHVLSAANAEHFDKLSSVGSGCSCHRS